MQMYFKHKKRYGLYSKQILTYLQTCSRVTLSLKGTKKTRQGGLELATAPALRSPLWSVSHFYHRAFSMVLPLKQFCHTVLRLFVSHSKNLYIFFSLAKLNVSWGRSRTPRNKGKGFRFLCVSQCKQRQRTPGNVNLCEEPESEVK